MEILTVLTIILLLVSFPVASGFVAKRLGRKFWFWFSLGLLLPFVTLVLVLCLPVKKEKTVAKYALLPNYEEE